MTVNGESVHTDSLTLTAKSPNTDMSVTAVYHKTHLKLINMFQF